MSSHDNHKKPAYDENIFLIHLPAFAFLVLGVLIGIISIKGGYAGRDPFPEPTLTAEEAQALRSPVVAVKLEPSAPSDPVYAEGMALIQKSDCVGCHKPNEKLLGPTYADIAAKYKGNNDALGLLVKKVKDGGSGAWGVVPMTPHPTMDVKDIEKMVKAILLVPGGKAPSAAPTSAEGASVVATTNVVNDEGMDLIRKSDCVACHKDSEKLIGPSYAEISAKYKDDADAAKKLAIKIKDGGQGVWGQVPMIPHPGLDNTTIEKMVKSILSIANTGNNNINNNVAVEKDDASAVLKQMEKLDCFACHKEREKTVGPSYLEIAKKYKGTSDLKSLIDKVKNGGQGVWGQIPMIPHPQLSEAEIEKMVKAILTVQ